MNHNQTYDLLIRYIDGETLPDETAHVEKLLRESEYWSKEHRFLMEVNRVSEAQAFPNADTREEWNRFITAVDPRSQSISRRSFSGYIYYAAAAIVLLVAGLYFLKPYFSGPVSEGLVFQSDANARILKLEDGSQVALQPHSRLILDKSFHSGNRKVQLSGTACFNVQSDARKPFVVYAQSTQTRVEGTTFSIRSTPDGEVSLKLYEGKIGFTAPGGHWNLQKGTRIEFSNKSKKVQQSAFDVSEREAWTVTGLEFQSETLRNIAQKLEATYTIRIQFPEKLKNERFTASFNGLDLDRSLLLLETLTDLKITKNHPVYTLMP